jgi:hypothetical protein
MKMSKATLQSIVVHRPEPTIKSKQHMCMDKGYDYSEVYMNYKRIMVIIQSIFVQEEEKKVE